MNTGPKNITTSTTMNTGTATTNMPIMNIITMSTRQVPF